MYFLDPLPPWRIPAVLRSVRAVVIPEHSFGVAIHQSQIPFEAIACGVTPLVSNEAAAKYKHIKEYIKTVDPLDSESFATMLKQALSESWNQRLLEDSSKIRNSLGDYCKYVGSVESVLFELASQ